MRIDEITIGNNAPEDINVIIEVPIGGEPVKYEMDKPSGTMFVDRFLYTSMRYPGNYGFIPHTLSDDGDPIDVLVCNTRPLIPGCVINCRPVGILYMKDEAGMDEKVIAVPSTHITAMYDNVHSISDIPEMRRNQISHFFERYKDLETSKWVEIVGFEGALEAKNYIKKGVVT